MNLINVDQFDTRTFKGIKAKIAAGILNARIVADDESFPQEWRVRAVKTLELAKSLSITTAEPFRYRDGYVISVQDGQVVNVYFNEGEYHVRV